MANTLIPIEERTLTPHEVEVVDARRRRGQLLLTIGLQLLVVTTLVGVLWVGQDLTHSLAGSTPCSTGRLAPALDQQSASCGDWRCAAGSTSLRAISRFRVWEHTSPEESRAIARLSSFSTHNRGIRRSIERSYPASNRSTTFHGSHSLHTGSGSFAGRTVSAT